MQFQLSLGELRHEANALAPRVGVVGCQQRKAQLVAEQRRLDTPVGAVPLLLPRQCVHSACMLFELLLPPRLLS